MPSAGRQPPAERQLPDVLPPDGAEYPQLLRGATYAWWRSGLGVFFGLALFALLNRLVLQVVVLLGWVITGSQQRYPDYFAAAYAFAKPVGLLGANLGITILIPISWAMMVALHQVRPRWLSSVRPRLRWRYLLGCGAVAVVILPGVALSSSLLSRPLHLAPQPGLWKYAVVILLTSPLQAAAEEVFFRGYLMQALGSLVARPWFGVVVSSVLFALLHGSQNVPLFVDRLVFGLLAAALVWRTGGLEAGIAAHVVNNIFAYLIAGLTTSIASLRAITALGWVDAAFDVAAFALFAVLAYGLSRLQKVQTRVNLAAN